MVEHFASDGALSEPRVMAEVAEAVGDGGTIFAGNSMPVRDLDAFVGGSDRRVRFLANRGASGIDGVVSSALGAAAVSDGAVVLVVGDVSFYHDMNGLLAASGSDEDVTIVVVNNDGGGIFSFLPQAVQVQTAQVAEFEPLFGTPHGLTFEAAASLYGLGYARAESVEALRRERWRNRLGLRGPRSSRCRASARRTWSSTRRCGRRWRSGCGPRFRCEWGWRRSGLLSAVLN